MNIQKDLNIGIALDLRATTVARLDIIWNLEGAGNKDRCTDLP